MQLHAFEETGKTDLRLAVAHNEISIAGMMTDEYDNAIAVFKSFIEMYQGLEEYWVTIDTISLTNIGFTYWIRGGLENASTTFGQLLRDQEHKFHVKNTESYR